MTDTKTPILREFDKPGTVIFQCLTGSHSLGLNSEGSDIDTRGIYVTPLRQFLSIRPPKEYIIHVDGIDDQVWDEVGRWFYLAAAKGNHERVSMLASPIQETVHPIWGRMLIDNLPAFISMKTLRAMYGFAESQLRRGHGIRGSERSNRKAIMHNIRLAWQGITLARTGELVVKLPPDLVASLMDLKLGRTTMDSGIRWANSLMIELGAEIKLAPLNNEPNWDRLNEMLYEIRMGNHD